MRVITAGALVMLMALQLPIARAVEPAGEVKTLSKPSDDVALNAIFGEPVLSQNAKRIVVTSRGLPPEQRYAYLSRWVLPNHGHSFRVDGSIERLTEYDVEVADPTIMQLADYPESQWILCPARELVQMARELGRLGALREQVLQQTAIANDATNGQATLLTLIDIAANERERVTDHLAERFTGGRNEQDADAALQWWSDLIVLWAAIENPKTADGVIEDYFGAFMLGSYKNDPRLDIIADYLCLLFRTQSNGPRQPNTQHALGTAMFDAFSRIDAFTHARGSPLTRYQFNDRGAVKLSGHENDYLAIRSPMTGNFEVVCEVATHAGAFSELVVAGVAAKPTPDLQRVSIGGFAKGEHKQAITPSIQPIGASSRIRVQSDTTKTTHYWNSHETYVDSHAEASAPWVAVRSWRRTQAAISEFSIFGSPTVPTQLDLIAGSTLKGWANYYDSESGGGLGNWSASVDDSGQWKLQCDSSGDARGCYDENLIYYVRPLTWDATVSYEFEYQPGSCAVHPCLGRSVFMIQPDGVWLHQLTDGRYDPSDVRPDNAVLLSDDASERVTLKEGWNRVVLRIESDRVSLWLNDHPIATHVIKPSKARTLGLFHYRDQTHARVRNVHLTGDWPRELPAMQEQPLASHKIAAWDAATEMLDDSWCHDFRQGIPPHLFTSDGNANLATQLLDGIRINRTGTASALNLDFAGQIQGDFDIVLEFKDLKIGEEKPTWHCGVGMAVSIENSQHDRIDIVRRRDRLNSHHHIVFARNQVNRFGGVDWVKDATHVDESVAGRLRMIRKGDVIYGLYADGDSKCFRYLGESVIESGTISIDGLRLYTIAGEGMTCAVTLVRLEVRAEAIDMPVEPKPQVFQIIDLGKPKLPPTKSLPGRF